MNVTEAVLKEASPTPCSTLTSRKGQNGAAMRCAAELTAKRRLPPIMKVFSGVLRSSLPIMGLSARDATLSDPTSTPISISVAWSVVR
jgi:hypothetical protein